MISEVTGSALGPSFATSTGGAANTGRTKQHESEIARASSAARIETNFIEIISLKNCFRT